MLSLGLHRLVKRNEMQTKTLTLIVLGVIGCICGSPPVYACSCVQTPFDCKQLAAADAVFEATVESLDVRQGPSPSPSLGATYPERLVRLKDVRKWWGEAQDSIVTALSEESCGYTFRTGVRYLVVAGRRADGRLVVSWCGLTKPLAEAASALACVRSFANSVKPGSAKRSGDRTAVLLRASK